MRKVLLVLSCLLAGVLPAGAQVYNIAAGASSSTINSTLSTAAAYNAGPVTVNFAAGIYTLTGQLNFPCPAQPTTYTGPATTFPANINARPTVHFINATTDQPQANIASCSTDNRFWKYIDWDGNQPTTGGGAMVVQHPQNHMTIMYNYFHGNEEIYPKPCINSTCAYNITPSTSITYYAYDDYSANLINLTGSNDGTATDLQNITIQYNIFGNPVQTYPTSQWVSSSTANLGVASSNGDCVNVQQWLFGPGTGSHLGYDTSGGNCVAIAIRGGSTGLHILDNIIQNQEQGGKNFECGSTSTTTCYLLDFQVERNDISGIHRIGWENQQSPKDNGVASPPSAYYLNNTYRNPKDPAYGGWMFSLPVGGTAGPIWNNSNLMISDCGNAANPNFCYQNSHGPGAFEYWASNKSQANYNLIQGGIDRGVQWGYGGYPPQSQCPTGASSTTCWQALYNTCEGNPSGTHGNPGYCVVAEGNQTTYPPLVANNAIASTQASHSSNTPTIPGSQTFTGSFAVTMSVAQYSSTTALPQGNINIWYTTDGSTPVPQAGTGKFYTGSFSISSTTTVKAVGMWGGQVQPGSYTSGYGFTPSPVVTATYTASGGTPTVVAPVFTPGSMTFGSPLSVTAATTTSGATLYCTTDGTTPTTSSPVYPSGGFTIYVTTTISCLGAESGYTNSTVTSALYTYSLYLGNNQQNIAQATYPNIFNAVYVVTGSSSGGYTIASGSINFGTTGIVTAGAKTDLVVFPATNGTTQGATALCYGTYTQTSATPPGLVTFPMTGCSGITLAANTAYYIDSITNDPLTPSALGGWNCGGSCGSTLPTGNNGTYRGSYVSGTYGSYTSAPTSLSSGGGQASQLLNLTAASSTPAATPVFTPASGSTFSVSQSVTITSSTAGASIFYTLDGSTPTTSSTLYTGAISLTATTTVNAIASASGFAPSAVSTATYTKNTTPTITSAVIYATNNVNYTLLSNTVQFQALFFYSNGDQTINTVVGTADKYGNALNSWISYSSGIGTMDTNGVFHPVSIGPVTLQATINTSSNYTSSWNEYVAVSDKTVVRGSVTDGVVIK